MSEKHPPVWATHSGTFHADDVLAYAILRLALGDGHVLLRTRDPEAIRSSDIVWDVGGEADTDRRRFDHHQRGAPVRPDGTAYSSAGLVWKAFGEMATRQALFSGASRDLVAEVAAAFDEEVVRRVDEIDNGLVPPEDKIGLADIVDDHNPTWDSPDVGNSVAEDAAFRAAAAKAQDFLLRRLDALRARFLARNLVAQAGSASTDPRILELEHKMPWQEGVLAADLPVLYAIYPVPGGNWMVDAMPPEAGSYEQRMPLPEAWAGLRGEALAVECGVPDAVFVHPRRFIGAAGSKVGALTMATLSIRLGLAPAAQPGC